MTPDTPPTPIVRDIAIYRHQTPCADRHGRPRVTVSVAIGIELASALDNVARRRYLTRAEMLREIICEYLAGVAGRGG